MSPDKTTLDELRINRSAPPPRGSRGWLILVVLLLLLAGGGAFWWFNRPKPVSVRTIAVQEKSSGGGGQQTLLNASGYVTARRIATVSSKVSGKVMEVLVEEGMKVVAGQVLAKIDASNAEKSLLLVEAQLEAARQALNETKANLERADRELQRVAQLAKDQIATQSDLDKADAEAKSLRARLTKQTADVEVSAREVAVWKQQLDDTIIRAPFPGVVTSKNAQPGEMISTMSAGGFTRTGICTIVDMGSLEIEVDVSESYINRVESGLPVSAILDSYPEWRIPAKVIAIIPTADRQKATVKVRVGFEKLDPRILPDMGVKVAFQSAATTDATGAAVTRSIVIPKAALRQRDGKDVIWVVRDDRAERRAVTLGPTMGDDVVIVAGLSGGDRVVTDPPENLTDNGRVVETRK
jgi:RND family efflux transporter MFP subunit